MNINSVLTTSIQAIALFNMIRAPLNVIPAWSVQLLQTKVALDRISTYLAEDEVSEQVSSLKSCQEDDEQELAGADVEDGLGIANGTFKWNEIEAKTTDPKPGSVPVTKGWSLPNVRRLDKFWRKFQSGPPAGAMESGNESSTEVESEQGDLISEGDHEFELRDISVMFPEGKLSVITGPTASGYFFFR